MTDRIATEWDCAIAHDSGYQQGYADGRSDERERIANWLRSLDKEGGEINRFLPTTLANWIGEGMHMLSQKEQEGEGGR